MRQRLLWKLLVGHIVPVFAIFTFLLWRAIDRKAADYLKGLEVQFHVSPVDLHRQFLETVHHNLFWGVLIALAVTLLFTYLLTSWVLRPLLQITDITKKVADGNYS
jgi:two-component system, OmpR family, sensor histidine kinase BaeS